ncbi:MAG TPA: FCD domain-containing protein [Actinocrinis sp.]|nr:FCD domain-containing protein [Actinocrinis sp.]
MALMVPFLTPVAGHAAAGESLSVDPASPRGTAAGVSEGFLYGVGQDGTHPADQYLQPLGINALRGGGHASGGGSAAFHRAVVAATGNETLVSLPGGISSQTVRVRVWRGMVDGNVAERTLTEHEMIYQAFAAGDAALAQAAVLMHVNTTAKWLRKHLAASPAPDALDDAPAHDSYIDARRDGRADRNGSRRPVGAALSSRVLRLPAIANTGRR